MIISLLFPFSLLLCIAIPSHILMANSILAAFELSKPEERLRYAVSKAKSQEKKKTISVSRPCSNAVLREISTLSLKLGGYENKKSRKHLAALHPP
jgi:hypothetical protein